MKSSFINLRGKQTLIINVCVRVSRVSIYDGYVCMYVCVLGVFMCIVSTGT